MSKSVEEVRRELFRSACVKLDVEPGRDTDSGYSNPYGDAAWRVMNAALDVVEIQLPPEVAQFADDDPGRRAFSLFTNTAIRSCRAAIEQTGLGIRVK